MKLLIKPLLLILLMSINHAALAGERQPSTVSHVVLMWLNEPGNQQAIKSITEVSYAFADIPGVLSVKLGAAIESERSIVDDSFDIGIILDFPNRKMMDAYLIHPAHKQAVREVIKPLVRKIIVYDIANHMALEASR